MIKTIVAIVLGVVIGIGGVFFYMNNKEVIPDPIHPYKPVVIGFMPYWSQTFSKDYSPYLDTIAYFGLTASSNGTIQKETNPGETEPGWLKLKTASFETFPQSRSLVVFSGDQDAIGLLISQPKEHAKNMMKDISPLIKKNVFTDVNIDIESVSLASPSAQQNFTTFVKTVQNDLRSAHPGVTLSIDVSPTALLKPYLTDVKALAQFVDRVIFMTYDYHYPGSSVTGGVAPQNGAGISAEFDVETAIKEALKILPKEKVILGVPLYGYQWETLSDYPRTGVIPGTGITASNKRVEELLSQCATCSAQFDETEKEAYIIYRDNETGTYHHTFYPDTRTMEEKIKLMKKYRLGGMALWALGYEGGTILDPLRSLH